MWLYVALGGGAGATLRYFVMEWVARRLGAEFPYSTLTVNILGSLCMGLLVGLLARYLPPHQQEIRSFVAVGVLGGFTTFSTFSLDALTLIERGAWGSSLLYMLASVLLCVAGLALGLFIVRSF